MIKPVADKVVETALPGKTTGAVKGSSFAEVKSKLRTQHDTESEAVQAQMKTTESKLDSLRQRVAVLPQEPAYEPLRTRLNNIEKKYSQSADYVTGVRANGNPADYLRIQLEMYQLTQNIELVSKVVDQVNGGVKSILQTQV